MANNKFTFRDNDMSGSNNAFGGEGFHQTINQAPQAGDRDQLESSLRRAGVSDDNIANLLRAIEVDGPIHGGQAGSRVQAWLADARLALTEASMNAVVAAVFGYLGFAAAG
ncbi:hypothetical protein AB0H60_06735 [Nocardia rhamnosiphila]|uniref:hypothetical protein n=1 Tax=Nocardia rhamnosiphila TaxID=426716 RepID=UPI0033E3385F